MKVTLREWALLHTALETAAEIRRHRFGEEDPLAAEFAELAERVDNPEPTIEVSEKSR